MKGLSEIVCVCGYLRLKELFYSRLKLLLCGIEVFPVESHVSVDIVELSEE